MLPVDFPRFPELAFELRGKIWAHAIALHIEQVAGHLPKWLGNYEGNRRQQRLAGTPPEMHLSGSFLRARILDPYNGLKIRFEEDEFEAFVDWLTISVVCHEARTCVAQFCQSLVSHVRCEYEWLPSWSLKPPKEGARPVVIRNMHCQPDAGSLKHFFSRPTILTMTMGRFKSAEHFVETVYRFFGNKIQCLILDQVVNTVDPFKCGYWADSNIPREDNSIDVSFVKYPEGDSTLMHVTRDGKLYAPESFWGGEFTPRQLAPHVLKIHEIFDFSLEKLPDLEHIKVNLEIRGWEKDFSRIEMIYKKDTGVLAVVSSSGSVPWPQPSPWVSETSMSAWRALSS